MPRARTRSSCERLVCAVSSLGEKRQRRRRGRSRSFCSAMPRLMPSARVAPVRRRGGRVRSGGSRFPGRRRRRHGSARARWIRCELYARRDTAAWTIAARSRNKAPAKSARSSRRWRRAQTRDEEAEEHRARSRSGSRALCCSSETGEMSGRSRTRKTSRGSRRRATSARIGQIGQKYRLGRERPDDDERHARRSVEIRRVDGEHAGSASESPLRGELTRPQLRPRATRTQAGARTTCTDRVGGRPTSKSETEPAANGSVSAKESTFERRRRRRSRPSGTRWGTRSAAAPS